MKAALAWLGLALAAASPAAATDRDARGGDWRRVATPPDRTRLRGWRSAWVAGLAEARGDPDGRAAIAADAALFDPDRTLADPLPPPGEYRCRTVKLGRKRGAGLAYVSYGWFRCLLGGGPLPAFAKVDGSQRQVGAIYPETDDRAVFLGTLSLGDERGAMPYRRDADRDLAAWVERIGERRWRMVFPYPAFESTMDLLEIAPG